MFKRILRLKAVQMILGGLLAAYMVLIKYTTRWTFERQDIAAPVMGTDHGVIALTWHSRFLLLNSAWSRKFQHPHVLISLSRDGGLVAYTTRFLRLSTIRGSARKAGKSATAKGGSAASRAITRAVEDGGCIVITPDGPRGPRQRLGIGPIRLARATQVPLMPCTFAVKHRIQFKSWDRFILPLPFGRGTIIWGTPVFVNKAADEPEMERIRDKIETEMNTFLIKADTGLGHMPTHPKDHTL